MSVKNKLKQLLTGLSIPQEYICLDLSGYQTPLSVFLTTEDNSTNICVTDTHLFLGYKPVIIGLPFNINSNELEYLQHQTRLGLSFSIQTSKDPAHSKILASLKLKRIGEKKLGQYVTLLFEGVSGRHSFLNSLNQFVNHQREKRRKNSAANINLDENLYDQVRIAYAVPRIISIISLGQDGLINMFPTDLHGAVGEKFYMSSLRIGGKANEQVEKFKNIVISDITASFYKQAYDLGKNHMRDIQQQEKFLTDVEKSEIFSLPLPAGFTEYRELKQYDSVDHGIHRIHTYEVINHRIRKNDSKLVHIHQYFGQWRYDNGLGINMLLR